MSTDEARLEPHLLYLTTPAGASDLAAAELATFGADAIKADLGGAACEGTLEVAYRACLWSRVANRVLLRLAQFPARTPEELYDGVRGIDWSDHLAPEGTLAVDCTSKRSAITHTQFAALKVKDAVVDQLRDRTGVRPSVELATPDVRLNLYLDRDVGVLSIDLSGDSLHRRGYRVQQGAAPLKENLAAAVLLRAGWPKLLAEREPLGFVDPMCGSGTLVIEAALIAADVAPGALRTYFGFQGWRQHDAALWRSLLDEAAQRRAAADCGYVTLLGFDRDEAAVRAAQANAARANIEGLVRFERRELAGLVPAPAARGLVAVNPPYGERLGEQRELAPLYELLGSKLREGYAGWHAAVLTGNPPLGRDLHLRATRTHRMYNGPIECRLLRFVLTPEHFEKRRAPGTLPAFDVAAARARPGAEMFANRLRKNAASLGTWARRAGIACYRVYDADMPEYAFSIDLYQAEPARSGGSAADAPAGGRWAYVQEYAPPDSVDKTNARKRREEALAVIPEVLGLGVEAVHLRTRRIQKDGAQYTKLAERGEFHTVQEGGLAFLVNFTDYLDTGLFLDHRPTRARLRELARDCRFLNLFAYTGTASVYAAAGGARTTTTVDMSATYLGWARRNLALNGFQDQGRHQLLQEDVLAWLETPGPDRYDLVFLDPPTLSRSKRMTREFDVQRDHVALIRATLRRLAPGGLLVFSNNFRKFKIDRVALADLDVKDVTAATIPKDFARSPRIHHCYEIRSVEANSAVNRA
jgi:23S rRNA (guanine2445-N2)-methyltransferase / 23S rRNA (guanine2069-N7)-methyltransferase